ncbi:MAG: phosphate ABC transporter permease PstA [Deltaproteobacteria bacterium]|nr:phosphate ABC transporter permease PstA [Deltaproteobacteria bacterium]
MNRGWNQGEHYVWATAAAVCLTLLTVSMLLGVVMVNGLGFFWPKALVQLQLQDGSRVLGELTGSEPGAGNTAFHEGRNLQIKVGNRDLYGQDFRWVEGKTITGMEDPPTAVMLERMEYGNFYGYLRQLRLRTLEPTGQGGQWERFTETLEIAQSRAKDIRRRQKALSELNLEVESLRLELAGLRRTGAPDLHSRQGVITSRMETLNHSFEQGTTDLIQEQTTLLENVAEFTDANGTEVAIPLANIARAIQPNRMSAVGKVGFYASKLWELLTGEPRESNTEGGLFPAIFGTVMMVILMSLFSLPLGVVAAIYLREYARDGFLVRMVRVAVYNLAGVPSIVFGVFGLGFFVYGVGGGLDSLFFADRLPTPTFGTGGILWASLTLALLTVPVVVVATEEGLSAIPRGLREASLALGATKFQTLVRVVMPMAVPGILTGFILAMARAVGEVAPLMITGVVKLAPSLPVDGQFPFIHLERKFMHLGFHIFDVGFQSPNVEAAKPMVYITTLLLILIVLTLSITAIWLRNRLRKKFKTATF